MEYVKTTRQLAIYLDCSQAKVATLKRKEGAPKKTSEGYNLKDWVSFYRATRSNLTGRPPEVDTSEDPEDPEDVTDVGMSMARLRETELKEKVKKLQIENQIKSENIMDVESVLKLWNEFAIEWKKVIENSGLDKIEKERCFKSLERSTDKIRKRHQRSVEKRMEST